ncbi:MAG TPA: hypothetical protein VGM98_22965 [Schlesneria sp.]
MTTSDFAYWLALFRTQLPSDDRLKSVGISWYPGVPDDQQERKLDEALKLSSPPRYQISLSNHSPQDDCIRIRVEAFGRQGYGEANFCCKPEVELDNSFTPFDNDEIEDMRMQLATMTSEIRGAWERFAKDAQEAQAKWLLRFRDIEVT